MRLNERNEIKKREHPTTLWTRPEQIGEILTESSYSVTSPDAIRKQYLKQVEHYPQYPEWFKWIMQEIQQKLDIQRRSIILEYGSGPGKLAENFKKFPNHIYTAVEPNSMFRQMTRTVHPFAKVVDGTAETFQIPNNEPLADFICATATYHHFGDKPLALKRIYQNLKPGGLVLIGDVFFPEYAYDKNYNPTNRAEFLKRSIEYAAQQILYMRNPDLPSIEDQLMTFLLDTLRYEELKVCLSILLTQLKEAGFTDIKTEQMLTRGQNTGWYKVSANKPHLK